MSIRVLVVDDAAFLRMQLKQVFDKIGAEVVAEAANGAECLEQYELFHPDLVTMDITMPDMDGITALRLLKKKHPDANVVMCSAMGQQEKLFQSIQAGAYDFIVKPFSADKIASIVKQLEMKK